MFTRRSAPPGRKVASRPLVALVLVTSALATLANAPSNVPVAAHQEWSRAPRLEPVGAQPTTILTATLTATAPATATTTLTTTLTAEPPTAEPTRMATPPPPTASPARPVVYLPCALRDGLLLPPTVTPTRAPSPTAIRWPTATPAPPTATRTVAPPTSTPTATTTPAPLTATHTVPPATPTQGTAQLRIGMLQCQGRDEYVRVDNVGGSSVNLAGWKIYSVVGSQTFTFSSYQLAAGASVYVHSGPDAPPTSGNHIRWTTSYIWNNDDDTAQLKNPSGQVVDEDRC